MVEGGEPTMLADDRATVDATTGRPAPPPSPAMRQQGEAIGRYVVLRRLGVGGMGEVYAAYDPELDRRVAIKLLVPTPSDGASRSDGSARLQREAQAMAKLVHPNVVAVHDVGVHGGQVFVAMEFLEGGDLRAWLERGPHPWREVLARFIQAGRGLAAAHAADLVHRDFKPENVLLTAKGQVKVGDFGLARRAGEVAPEAALAARGAASPELDLQSSGSLDVQLTVTGARMGTPGYMAPEQWLGEEVGPPADQFAFCVALYEGLYGERPHRGDSMHAQMFQVTEEIINDPPRGARVPTWLRKVVLRGLRSDPAARWPSMDDLLAALGHDPHRRWWWIGGALVIAGAVGLGFALAPAVEAPAPRCVGAGDELAEIWNEDRATAVRDAFVATEASYADKSASTAIARLDDFAGRWREARRQSCADTLITGKVPESVMIERDACLDRRARELEGLVELYVAADEGVVRKAVALAETLSSVDPCLDATELAKERIPDDPEVATKVAAINAVLSRADQERLAGHYDVAGAQATKALEQARDIGFAPLVAQAEYTAGVVFDSREDTEARGIELLEASLAHALATGDDRLFARAASRLAAARKGGEDHGRNDQLYALGFAALERVGGAPGIRASLAMNYGNELRERGELDAAREQFKRALADYETAYGPEHMFTGDAHFNLGTVAFYGFDYETARIETERARAIWSDQIGPEHPRAITALSAAAVFASNEGDHPRALELFERQLALNEKLHGKDSKEVSQVLTNLGSVYRQLDRIDEAVETLERGAALREKKFGAQSAQLGFTLANLASTLADTEQLDRALATAERAFELILAEEGPEGNDMWVVHVIRGEVLLRRGDPAAALRDFERARTIAASAIGEDSPPVADAEWWMARAHLAAGTPEPGLALIDAALAGVPKGQRSAAVLAELRAVRAELLRALDRDDEARAEADRARQALEDAPYVRERLTTKLEALP